MRIIAEGTALTYNCDVETVYTREFVPLINDAEATDAALAAAAAVFGADATSGASDLNTASEDFARFLDHAPGCFAFIGNGEASAPLHNPTFDFNDAALVGGMRFHAAIARQRLPTG